jgi:hypothetical protein
MRNFAVATFAIFTLYGAPAADWGAYRVFAPNEASIAKLRDSEITMLSEVVGPVTDVAAPSEKQLRALGLKYQRIGTIADPIGPYTRETDGADYTTEYLRYSEIIDRYEAWRSQYPSLITRQQIGVSIQNRPMWVYRIHNPNSAIPKTAILIQAGIHAREWISPPIGMYIMDRLLHDALGGAEGWNLISRYEVNIIPSVNPDGYEYSWSNNRLWRKNRRDIAGSSFFGVDLNRNYAKGWGGQGSSGQPGSETYRGTAPFSEPEVANIRDYIDSRVPKIDFEFAIDYHSYAQKILYPWSYTETAAPDAAEFDRIGNVYRTALIASGGVNYQVGQGAVALYIASGASKDFYYDQYGTMAYTVEVRPVENDPGFVLPPSQILPTIRENWAGFKAVLLDLQ